MSKITKLALKQTAALSVYRDRWIANAVKVGRMTSDERVRVVEAVAGLYAAAGIPQPKSIVIVPSPRMMAISGGRAAWWWRCRKTSATCAATDEATDIATYKATYAATHAATRGATYAATRAATDEATYAATEAATYAATDDATYAATDEATYAATDAATNAATRAATDAATDAATFVATDAATDAATEAATDAATREATYAAAFAATRDATLAAALAATQAATLDATYACAMKWYTPAQGGSEWSGWCAFLTFWRDEMGLGKRPELQETYAKFRHWETLATLSGYRWMSPDFCMVSERPIKLSTYVNGRGTHVAHCADGPSHLWADGFSIYHLHGIRVEPWIVEHPEQITVAKIKAEENAEVRRVMRERFGEGRYLHETGAKLIDADFEGARKGAAPRALLQDEDGERWLVGTDGSTSRVYYMPVQKDVKTCRDAHVAICGFDEAVIVSKS